MNQSLNMGLAPGVCPLCRHDPCDCATVAPPLDLSQFKGHTPGDWVDKRGSIQGKDALSVAGEGAIIDVICWIQISNQPRWEADGHLVAHAPALLDRARELEVEVERLKVVAYEDFKHMELAIAQREELEAEVERLDKLNDKLLDECNITRLDLEDKVESANIECSKAISERNDYGIRATEATTQRDDLAGALEALLDTFEVRDGQVICRKGPGVFSADARAALARVQGDGDKEGGGGDGTLEPRLGD